MVSTNAMMKMVKHKRESARPAATAVATKHGAGGIPVLLRMAGFTTTMYDIVVNVVSPAITFTRDGGTALVQFEEPRHSAHSERGLGFRLWSRYAR